MKIDRSMFEIEDNGKIPPLEIKSWLEILTDAFIEDTKDTIQFLLKDIGVMASVIEICGAESDTGQQCSQIIRLNRADIEQAYYELEEYYAG